MKEIEGMELHYLDGGWYCEVRRGDMFVLRWAETRSEAIREALLDVAAYLVRDRAAS